jgi:hypothetical protein
VSDESSWPRVTGSADSPGIIYELLGDRIDTRWFEARHRRRGTLVHAGAHILARRETINDNWWYGWSGVSAADRVEHEECRPYLDGVALAVRELEIELIASEQLVRNPIVRYYGHYDWLLRCRSYRGLELLDNFDIKCGGPPPPDSITDHAHRIQTALYAMAIVIERASAGLPSIPVRRAALYLPGDGSYRLRRHRDPGDKTRALILAQAWWIRHTVGPTRPAL